MSAAGLCVMPSGWHPAACRRISPLLSEHPRAILAVLDSPGFADKSPGQVYTILLDRGVYLCSEASMYRLLRERGQSGDRRAQATHPAKKKPELMADGPDQVWSWDISELKGPARGIWYLLYVIIDIYSRKVIHWEAWPTENGTLAKEFIEHAIEADEGARTPGRPDIPISASWVTDRIGGPGHVGGMLRVLPGDYLAAFGVRLMAVESLTDPGASDLERRHGTRTVGILLRKDRHHPTRMAAQGKRTWEPTQGWGQSSDE